MDRRFATMCLYVRSSGPVASFATCVLGGFLAGRDTPEMRILVELQPDIGMAGFTDSTPYIIALGILLCSSHQRQDKQRRESEPGKYTSPTIFGTGLYEH